MADRNTRPVLRALVMMAALLAIAGSVYYFFQSRADECFHWYYLALLLGGGIVALAHIRTRAYPLLPISGILLGVAFGVMVHDMLPTMSDVWNGVNFIGGNLTAYLIYTGISLVVAVIMIVAAFRGTEKEI